MRLPKWVAYVQLGALLALPIVLLALPATFFDTGSPKCLSILLAGQECFACGTTRSVMHLLHFDFETAAYYNPIGFAALPLLIIIWFSWVTDALRKLGFQLRGKKA